MTTTRKILRRRRRFQKMRQEMAKRLGALRLSDASWPAGQLSANPA